MNQPDIGLRVTELRQQKGITQEKLAEYCEVSTRTIQRIENGEVEPRPFTRNSLSNILEFDFGSQSTGNENFWLALLHLSSALCIVFIPMLLWSWKKNQSYKIDRQGRAVLNFQITVTVVMFAFVFFLALIPVILGFVTYTGVENGMLKYTLAFIPALTVFVTVLFAVYQAVVNAFRSLSDRPIRYPFSIQFVK